MRILASVTLAASLSSKMRASAFTIRSPIRHAVSGPSFGPSFGPSPSDLRTSVQKGMKVKINRSILSATGDSESGGSKKASVSLTGISPSSSTSSASEQPLSVTSVLDYIISILTSDIGSIVLGLAGLTISLANRLSAIDYGDNADVLSIGQQSRSDLLAVFASGAVLLNGISKLDITSALAESVVLDGTPLDQPLAVNNDAWQKLARGGTSSLEDNRDANWALESILDSTPAKTAILLLRNNNSNNSRTSPSSQWVPILLSGIVPTSSESQSSIPNDRSTPILDRFVRQGSSAKESYLPTLQALPGKVEFTYLPPNAQEALLLPIITRTGNSGEGMTSSTDGGDEVLLALVLGSDTAKSFTPRDVAWCQALAARIGEKLF